MNKFFTNFLLLLLSHTLSFAQQNLEKMDIGDTSSVKTYMLAQHPDAGGRLSKYLTIKDNFWKADLEIKMFYLEQIIELSQTTGDTKTAADYYLSAAILLCNSSHLNAAIGYIHEAEKCNLTLKDEFISGKIYHAYGWYYHNSANYDEALQNYKKCIDTYEKIGFDSGVKKTYIKQSLSYVRMMDYPNYLKVAKDIYEDDRWSINYVNLGTLIDGFYTNQECDSVIYYAQVFDRQYSLEKHQSYTSGLVKYKLAMCEKNFEEALKLLLEDLDRQQNNKISPKKQWALYQKLATTYEQLGKPLKAKDYASKALQIVRKESLELFYQATFVLCKRLAEKTQDDQLLSDITMQEEFFNKRLDLQKRQSKLEQSRYELLIDFKQNEIDRLEEEKSETRKRNQKTIMLLSLALIGALISSILYLKFKNISKELANKNQALDQSLRDKVTLLQETHHRVKNNLQIVASLLNLQRKYTKDQQENDLLLNSRNRVKSMALIHQMLYKDETLKGIDSHTYISTLLSSLASSHKINQKGITLKSNIEKLILHEDTLLNIGLIINELTTNAIKYAFKEKEEGGQIIINLKHLDDVLLLSINDNGNGLDKLTDFQQDSFGYSLVKSLVKKLKGEMYIETSEGTKINIEIKKFGLISL